MFSSTHKCEDIDCAINGLKGLNEHDTLIFSKGHPKSSSRPALIKSDKSVTKTAAWLRTIHEITNCQDDKKLLALREKLLILGRVSEVRQSAGCKAALAAAIKNVEANYERIIESKHIGKIGVAVSSDVIPMAIGGKKLIVSCLAGEVSFLSNLVKPFADYRFIFAKYEQATVEDFITCIQGEEKILWRTPAQLKKLADLALEMKAYPLRDVVTGSLIEKMGIDEVVKVLAACKTKEDDTVAYLAAKKCRELFLDLLTASADLQLLSAEAVESICRGDQINANEYQIWQFIRLWKKTQTPEQIAALDLEECVRFEHTNIGWFDGVFGTSEEHRDLLSLEKTVAWLRYLDPKEDGRLPLEAPRNAREAIKRKKQEDAIIKLPNVMTNWLSTRRDRYHECIRVLSNSGKGYPIDALLVKEGWLMKADFSACSDEALEDFILTLYGFPIEYRSFETLDLFIACDKMDAFRDWIVGRIEKDGELTIEGLKKWLHELNANAELPIEVIQAFSWNLFKLAIDPENIQKIPESRFLSLIGNHKYYATAQQLWDIVEMYAAKYAEGEIRSAFYNRLSEAIGPGSSREFCALLLERKILNDEQYLAINHKRSSHGNDNKEPLKAAEVVNCCCEYVNSQAKFILVCDEGYRHEFVLKLQAVIVRDRHEVIIQVQYMEGPPCILEICPTYMSKTCKDVFRLSIMEGKTAYLTDISKYLRHFTTISHSGKLEGPFELTFRIVKN